jgi:hypothetical protein
MGYEPVSTPDAEEALRLIRMGRCRVVFASTHLETPDPFDFLDRALLNFSSANKRGRTASPPFALSTPSFQTL